MKLSLTSLAGGARPLLVLSLLIALGAGAWAAARALATEAPAGAARQSGGTAPAARGRNLALQPAALGLGRKLGRRFMKPGREVSVLHGTLTVGSDSRQAVIRRVQDGAGERIEVTVAGRGAPLVWDAVNGTSRAGSPADDEAAALASRLALDSPDQFVLAQLRGASYLVVAHSVRADVGGAEGYSGPLHDVVRVGEPGRGEGAPPAWRLYHLNTATGLLDKVVSEEGGERIEAVFSGWAEHGGEWQPGRVTWSRGGQTFMELALTNAAHGPQQ